MRQGYSDWDRELNEICRRTASLGVARGSRFRSDEKCWPHSSTTPPDSGVRCRRAETAPYLSDGSCNNIKLLLFCQCSCEVMLNTVVFPAAGRYHSCCGSHFPLLHISRLAESRTALDSPQLIIELHIDETLSPQPPLLPRHTAPRAVERVRPTEILNFEIGSSLHYLHAI